MTKPLAVVTLLGALLTATGARAVPITTCGQVVTERDAALVGDLDCSAAQRDIDVILMKNGGILSLNGFTVIGPRGEGAASAVRCSSSCEVVGPGTIIGGDANSVVVRRRLRMRNVSVRDGGGISAQKVVLDGCTIADNASGIRAIRVTLTNSTISGNDNWGLYAYTATLLDSVVEDNGADPARCTSGGACVDVFLERKLRLLGTSRCLTGAGNAVPHGTCSSTTSCGSCPPTCTVCGVQIITCTCPGTAGIPVCVETTEGGGACVNSFAAVDTPCSSSAECPPGWVCALGGCELHFCSITGQPCHPGPGGQACPAGETCVPSTGLCIEAVCTP
jgi:hypothetical protein